MNMYIELVKKWLKDKDSVSLEELEANKKAADAAWFAADEAAKDAYSAAYYAAEAAHWVEKYEELTK